MLGKCWDRLRPSSLPHPVGRVIYHVHFACGSPLQWTEGWKKTAPSLWSKNPFSAVWDMWSPGPRLSDSPLVSVTQKICFEQLRPMGSLKGRCQMTRSPQNKFLCPHFSDKDSKTCLGQASPSGTRSWHLQDLSLLPQEAGLLAGSASFIFTWCESCCLSSRE